MRSKLISYLPVNSEISRQVIRSLICIKACKSYDEGGTRETKAEQDVRTEDDRASKHEV